MEKMGSQVADTTYGWTIRLPGRSLAEARKLATDALQEQGFGILTEIDVKATLKKKLDRDFRPYLILGACNPKLANRALEAELPIGLLLPCNVCLWQDGDATVVAIARPDQMFKIVDRAALEPVAREAQERLASVATALQQAKS